MNPINSPDSSPLHIVVNAASGRHDGDATLSTITGILGEAGRAHHFHRIDDPARIADVASQAVESAKRDGGMVVAVGGDGTLNAVAEAVIGSGCVYAVLPQGTFNYFGRVNGISQQLEAATRALLRGQRAEVQVGRVNGKLFLVNASLGLYPQLLQDRETAKKQIGRSRWVALFSGLRTLLGHHRQLQLEIESGGQRRSVRTPTLFVGNNQLQLERIGIAEEAALAQGWLAGIMVRPTGAWEMLGLALRGALGNLGDAENVESFSFRRLTVTPRGQRRAKVAIDGEILWLRTPLVFDVSPEPLTMLLPAPEDRVAVE